MIRHIWTIVCSRSLIDEESQNITLIDALEHITIPSSFLKSHKINKLPLQLEVVTLWNKVEQKSKVTGRAILKFLSPEDEVLEEQSYTIDLTEFNRSRTRIRVSNLPLTTTGIYHFCVYLEGEKKTWQECAKIPIQIEEV